MEGTSFTRRNGFFSTLSLLSPLFSPMPDVPPVTIKVLPAASGNSVCWIGEALRLRKYTAPAAKSAPPVPPTTSAVCPRKRRMALCPTLAGAQSPRIRHWSRPPALVQSRPSSLGNDGLHGREAKLARGGGGCWGLPSPGRVVAVCTAARGVGAGWHGYWEVWTCMLVRALVCAGPVSSRAGRPHNRRRRCADGGYVPGLWDAAAGCL